MAVSTPSSVTANTCKMFANKLLMPRYSIPRTYINTVLLTNFRMVARSKPPKPDSPLRKEFFARDVLTSYIQMDVTFYRP